MPSLKKIFIYFLIFLIFYFLYIYSLNFEPALFCQEIRF